MVFVRWTVLAFSLILALAGMTALLHPSAPSATSQASAYAWFHLGAATAGVATFFVQGGRSAPYFALAFGALDLYQWIASSAGWFPQSLFRWTPTDDGLHLGLGLGLVGLGFAALGFRWTR